jgi:hypothetical protein
MLRIADLRSNGRGFAALRRLADFNRPNVETF